MADHSSDLYDTQEAALRRCCRIFPTGALVITAQLVVGMIASPHSHTYSCGAFLGAGVGIFVGGWLVASLTLRLPRE